MPQVAVGGVSSSNWARAERNEARWVAKRHGTDFYVSATKLLLRAGCCSTERCAPKTNQNGLLGFGATR
jgi:hypothetical protein